MHSFLVLYLFLNPKSNYFGNNLFFSAGAHLAFLRSCNTVAFLQDDDDICI